MTLRNFVVGSLAALLVSCSSPTVSPSPVINAVTSDILQKTYKPDVAGVLAVEKMLSSRYVKNADHYYMEAMEFTRLSFAVKVVYHASFEALTAAHPEGKKIKVGTLMAFTYPNKNLTGVCEIHILHPKVLYYPQFVGHEFLHCVHGDFHPTQGF